MRRLTTILLLGPFGFGTACLYTGPITAPPDGNSAPVIEYGLPYDEIVYITELGQKFEVGYRDDDPEDVPLLQVEWELDARVRGTGDAIYVYPEDLGQDDFGVLSVTVRDPQGGKALWRWNVYAAESTL